MTTSCSTSTTPKPTSRVSSTTSAAGAEVVIAKAGKPMARLVPIDLPVKSKKLGLLKGKIKVGDDFNAPLDDETLGLFEGS